MPEALLELRIRSTCTNVLDNGISDSLRYRLVVGPGNYLQSLGRWAGEPDGGGVRIHAITVSRVHPAGRVTPVSRRMRPHPPTLPIGGDAVAG